MSSSQDAKDEGCAEAPTEVVGAALLDDLARPTRLLAARRSAPPSLAGGWELPGGKVDPGETAEAALHRELAEELGIRVVLGEPVPGPLEGGRWALGDRYVIRVWLAQATEGDPAPLEDHDELRWVDATEAPLLPWLPADLPIVAEVVRRLA